LDSPPPDFVTGHKTAAPVVEVFKGGASMSTDQNKAVVRRFSEEFKNRANHAIVDELLAKNFVHHFKDPRLPPGRDALKALGGAIVQAFPDVKATIENLVAEGDRVVERTTATGTHKGPFNGMGPTGRKVTWTELHEYRLANGKVVELWSEIDMLAILMQLGALPPA
jgi:predicted ester cyclase